MRRERGEAGRQGRTWRLLRDRKLAPHAGPGSSRPVFCCDSSEPARMFAERASGGDVGKECVWGGGGVG